MRRLLIDHIPGETRAAILQDDELCALHILQDHQDHELPCEEGYVYRGRVVNIVPTLQAAFVDIGTGENGFLPVNATFADDISKALHEGQAITVQLRKKGQGGKGPLLTCKIDLKSEDCVFTAYRAGLNISRKIADEDKRTSLKNMLADTFEDSEHGLIVRTNAQDKTEAALREQVEHLSALWDTIQTPTEKLPSLILGEDAPWPRLIKRLGPESFDEITIEGIEAFQQLKEHYPAATHYSNSPALFEGEGIEEFIEQSTQKTIALKGGGNIVIEPTTALIAVDVNMAERLDGKQAEDNKLRVNLTALKELAQQIQLRNLSGQFFVDFITLKNKGHRTKLRTACMEILKEERTTVHGFTKLGLLEVSRQRLGESLDDITASPETFFYIMIRTLAQGCTQKRLNLGPKLYDLWTQTSTLAARQWLKNRLGYTLQANVKNSLPPLEYEIQD
ncbi:putative Ribonuclease G [Candidatus Terasakiella magnetica]|uniref:Putative Ribonuclease G n=1 Tax=Candidatus Terasakiella magnetica TaxID=1867952 RepID=A0A1C3RHJ3_9PROT|nr:ribonuclease E/G [Candidatus Terasakiella magnetica]SCA56750.1 putative Ribonuclease G [Candidatus Terasakiella magnetica]